MIAIFMQSMLAAAGIRGTNRIGGQQGIKFQPQTIGDTIHDGDAMN
jgi:hypothetical protein